MGDKRIDSRAIQVVHLTQIDRKDLGAVAGCGVERVGEVVDVAGVDLADGEQHRLAVGAALDADGQRRAHRRILVDRRTTVPVASGRIETSSINASMIWMPRPRWV